MVARYELGLAAAPLNDYRPEWAGVTAWVYGPHVLAGLTKEWPHNSSSSCSHGHWGEGNHQDPSCIDTFKPPTRAYKVTTAAADPGSFIKRVEGGSASVNASLFFEATDSTGKTLQMIAISEVMLETYTVYFNTMPTTTAASLPAIATEAQPEERATVSFVGGEEEGVEARPHASPRWIPPSPSEL